MNGSRTAGLAIVAALFVGVVGCTDFRKHGTNPDGGAGGRGGAFPTGTGGNGGGATGGSVGTGGSGGDTTTGSGGVVGTGGGGGTCADGMHKCGDTCVANTSADFCGPSCIKCPGPAGGTATCNGTSCDFDCGTMKKCAGSLLCVPTSGCCSNSDCPAMGGGQTGTCDSTTHRCNYNCPANMQACTTGGTTTCIAAGGCCQNSDCTGECKICSPSHTCVAAANMDDPTGRCSGTCNASGVCKSKRGQLCSTVAAGCVEGTSCAPDGYCCNSACTGSCQACDIQGMEGTCTNVNSGAPHRNHTACGTDPVCQGTCSAGACTYTAKTCGSGPTCSGSTLTPQSMCMSGACVTPTAQACPGSYACSGTTACATTCSGTTGCASTSYCAGTSCAAKKAAGTVCSANEECTGNLCGKGGASKGRCCNAGAPCSCPQPSTGNLVVNPGFDQNLNGWTVTNNSGSTAARIGTEDAAGCPFSGALAITSPSDTGAESTFSQCVTLPSAAVYQVGIQWKVLPTNHNAGIECWAGLTNNSTCSISPEGPSQTMIISDLYPLMWSGYDPNNRGIRGEFDNSSGTYARLKLSCLGRNGIAVDMVYVNTVASY